MRSISAVSLVGVLFAVVLLAYPGRLLAQALSGITGTVTDSTGAVVADAKVTITNNATGVVRTVATSSAGTYTITDLIPGTYTVSVEKTGFQTALTNGVVVDPGGKYASADATLKTGDVTQRIEITAQAISLETSQPELGATIEHKVVEEMPLQISGGRGRQIDSFLFLAPGVQGDSFSHRINGGVDFQNEVVFNGIPAVQAETQGFQTQINPPYEMVNEFRVLTNVFSAQYGLAQGVAAYQFASGTNVLHGDAFELLRNDMFDAKGAFNQTTPTDKEHNYGFSVAGPVYLPKVYNGRDKTFFHVSAEWYRLNNTPTAFMTVPTPAEKLGDFSGLTDSGGAQIPIFVPSTFTAPAGCNVTPGQQFPGNKIPQACFSQLAASLLTEVPDPTLSTPVRNLTSQLGLIPTRQTSWGFSIDHNLTQKQALHGSFWRDSQTTTAVDNNAFFGNVLSGAKSEPRLGTGLFLTYSNAISSNLVVTAGMGWLGELNNEFNQRGVTQFPGVTDGTVLPRINFGCGGGSNCPVDQPNDWGAGNGGETFSINRKLGISFANNWLLTHGRHTLNFGFEIRRAYQDDHECQFCGGTFNFSKNTTSNPANPGSGGSGFASFLIGQVDSATRQFALEARLRNFYLAPYIQDNIKVTPKLTVDIGLRWDIMRPFTENDNSVVFFDPTIPNPGALSNGQPLPGALTKFGSCSGCAGFDHGDIHWRQFSPRLGFAYQLNRRTVILAGFALNHLDGGSFEFGTNKTAVSFLGLLAGDFAVSSSGGTTPAYGSWDGNPIPAVSATPFSPTLGNGTSVHAFNRDQGNAPYTQTWNFGVQRELPWNMFLSASYIGARSIHLDSALQPFDQLDPRFLSVGNALIEPWTSAAGQTALTAAGFTTLSGGFVAPYSNFLDDFGAEASTAQALRPFPMYSGIQNNFEHDGSATYNALQAQAQKRFTNGLSFLVSYTLSKTMSNTDSGFTVFSFQPMDKFNQKAEWSPSFNDHRNLINISGVYELPIGPGKTFLNKGGALAKNLVGGWQLSGILQYQSGNPVNDGTSGVGANGDPLLNGLNRANLVSGQSLAVTWANANNGLQVINPAAFADPGLVTPGNAPRTIGNWRYPWGLNENVALAKRFFFGERVSAELRIEFFNLLNRVVVAGGNCGPNNNVSDSNFGLVTNCQNNAPRQGQAYFKVNF